MKRERAPRACRTRSAAAAAAAFFESAAGEGPFGLVEGALWAPVPSRTDPLAADTVSSADPSAAPSAPAPDPGPATDPCGGARTPPTCTAVESARRHPRSVSSLPTLAPADFDTRAATGRSGAEVAGAQRDSETLFLFSASTAAAAAASLTGW